MKYKKNSLGDLIIENDSDKTLFYLTKNNKYWVKYEYDHNGKEIYNGRLYGVWVWI